MIIHLFGFSQQVGIEDWVGYQEAQIYGGKIFNLRCIDPDFSARGWRTRKTFEE